MDQQADGAAGIGAAWRMHRMRSSNDNESRRAQDRRRLAQNIAAAIWLAALLYGSYHLVVAFMQNQREQECLARGYRTCVERDLSGASEKPAAAPR
jgi:hypothetical protein